MPLLGPGATELRVMTNGVGAEGLGVSGLRLTDDTQEVVTMATIMEKKVENTMLRTRATAIPAGAFLFKVEGCFHGQNSRCSTGATFDW